MEFILLHCIEEAALWFVALGDVHSECICGMISVE